MEQQQAPTQRISLSQKADAIAGLALYPAQSLMVFTRNKVGYRFIDPIKLMVMTFILVIFAGITTLIPVGTHTLTSAPFAGGYTESIQVANGSPLASLYPLIVFALLMFAAGMIERYLRFKDIKNGVKWHSYSRGISWLSYLFPKLQDNMVKRFLEPAAIAVIGFLLSLLPFHFLGYYIIFAAVCLFIFEAWDYEKSIGRMLDVIDAMDESEVVSENVDYYSQPNPTQRPLEQTAGIPTGIAPDIEAQIQHRRRNRVIPVDNLVTPQPSAPLQH